jgi:hypothetical protein
MKPYMRDWIGNLQAALADMVTMATLVKGQRSDSGKLTRIFTLCVHFLTCNIAYPA